MKRLLLSTGLVATLSACGGGSGGSGGPTTPTVPTPSPSAPLTRSVLDTRTMVLRRGSGFFYNQDRLPEGTLDATMDWQNGDVLRDPLHNAGQHLPGHPERNEGRLPRAGQIE